jgi:hypothetical protein
MSVDKILAHLHTYPPRYGPEWGSGGIFGLKYYRELLYFTLAFEGEAHFIKDFDEQSYNFQLVGKGPTSGGDTYNAVETVDEYLYFGGWVHAPAIYEKKRINFKNKYSHVHEYNIDDDYIKLLWKDSIHHPTKWAGEISDIIYDPHNNRLLLAREDGDENLGIYSLDRDSGEVKKLREEPTLKGDILHDSIFFASGDNFSTGIQKILVLDILEEKWKSYNVNKLKALDGDRVFMPSIGDVAAAYNRIFTFVRGGFLVGNPINGEKFTYIRVLDFFTFQAPMRSNALYVNGGILVPYNSHHDAIYRPQGLEDKLKSAFSNSIVSPTLLLYITPPMVKIVGVFGARITSLEKIGDNILIATNTAPNVGAEDATPYDTGYRGFSVMNENALHSSPPPVSISLPTALPSFAKKKMKYGTFGGIPLDGYKEPRLIFYSSKKNEIKIHEYDLSLPINPGITDKFEISAGKNEIDLSSFSGIVSFSLAKEDFKGKIRIELR